MEKSTTTRLHNLSELRKNLGNSVLEGLSFFKDGLTDKVGKAGKMAGSYINNLSSPVNNFLKDVSQIEQEFADELKKNEEFCICLDGKMVPANEVLSLPMEENY